MAKNKAIILLILAVLVALMVAVLAYNWLQKKAAVVQSIQTEQIAVAQTDMNWATVLTKDKVKMASYIKSTLPSGYFNSAAALEGRTLIYPVKANEPIFESKLAQKSLQGGGVAAVISPKKRAMAVKVDKVVGVSGFINPGNRVDVLVSLSETRQGKFELPITKTVLENILVLAAGTELQASDNREKAAQVDVITLEVTPEEGEKLAHAAAQGKLQLALRNAADTEEVLTKGVTVPGLLTSYTSRSTSPADGAKKVVYRSHPRPATVSNPTTYSIEIIKGGKVSEQRFGRGE
jgi:pilus assembly protein CpaB